MGSHSLSIGLTRLTQSSVWPHPACGSRPFIWACGHSVDLAPLQLELWPFRLASPGPSSGLAAHSVGLDALQLRPHSPLGSGLFIPSVGLTRPTVGVAAFPVSSDPSGGLAPLLVDSDPSVGLIYPSVKLAAFQLRHTHPTVRTHSSLSWTHSSLAWANCPSIAIDWPFRWANTPQSISPPWAVVVWW